MVARLLLVLMVSLYSGGNALAQLVFNKTEYDFGSISQKAPQFEQDFIFRNTGTHPAKILSVRSVQSALGFIYTRSDVLPGEYGFVKVKIYPDSLDGLFHDEVYITMMYHGEIVSEVLYVRAMVEAGGKSSDDRAFVDGAISTSVEVSPEDIETMEGFMGGDKLSRASSEIEYLKKQVQLKNDLIAKLSDDLFQKQEREQENIKRLSILEQTLKDNKSMNNDEALVQIEELSHRLMDMHSSDSLLRREIYQQETQYKRLKEQADSARNYAQSLSSQLQERFESEARAMEKAQRLEQDLVRKERIEKQQQQQIDSLSRLLQLAGDQGLASEELERLREELALRIREQELQREHVARQNEKISALKKENEHFKQHADSLANVAASSSGENEKLMQRLAESDHRIRSFEQMIDSLKNQTGNIGAAEKSTVEELEKLQSELAAIELRDRELKSTITNKDNELQKLQSERDLAKKNMEALERATTKQQEQAQDLMHRINSLADKESAAQLEIISLKNALKESQYKSDSTRSSVNELVEKISVREASIQSLSSAINQKELLLTSMRTENAEIQQQLEEARGKSNADHMLIDSLQQALADKNEGSSQLENDIIMLQRQVLSSKNKMEDYKARANELEDRLSNAHLSNDLTFNELKGDIDAMTRERDLYKDKYRTAEIEIERLNAELAESRRNEESAIAFANEMQESAASSKTSAVKSSIVFSVNVLTSATPVDIKSRFPGEKSVREYTENNSYKYAIGQATNLKDAIAEKERLKKAGHPQATIIAFKNGKRISLKEALEAGGKG